MEIVRLVVVHLLIGATISGTVAGWVVARWATMQFWSRARPPRMFSRRPKVAEAKIVRGLARDLLLQSAD